nr:hypothetical protein [Polyangiaceae bacterium]
MHWIWPTSCFELGAPMQNLRSLGLLSLLALSASSAAAQTAPSREDKVAADALFDEGQRLMQQQKYPEACAKFEGSQKLDPGVGILLYLADCYRKAGRNASAWTTFREAATAAHHAGQAEREKVALRSAAELETSLARLQFLVVDPDKQPTLVIKRNGATVNRLLWSTALPIDPGPQDIEASAEGKKTWSTRLPGVSAGQTLTIPIPLLEPAPAPPPVASSAPVPAPAASSAPPVASAPPPLPSAPPAGEERKTLEPSSQRTWALVAAGAGLVGLGVGSYFGLRTFSLWDDAEKGCPAGRCTSDEAFNAGRDARRAGNLSSIFFGLGVVGLGAGAALWFTAPA